MVFVWENPKSVSTNWLKNKINTNLKDTFIQQWIRQCNDTNKACNYHLYKSTFGFEKYLDILPLCYSIAMTKIRTSNHKLPIEKGRYTNIHRENRTCTLCNTNNVGDEYHFLLECTSLSLIREKYIPKYYSTRPNYYKYSQLLSVHQKSKLLKISKFIKEGLSLFK